MRRALCVSMFALVVVPRAAFAVNDTLATAAPALLGEVRTETVTSGDVRYFNYWLTPNRSYAAFCWSPSAEGTALSANTYVQACSVEIRDSSDAIVAFPQVRDPMPPGGRSAVWIPSTCCNYFVRVSSTVTGTVRALMLETTLFAPWYFVNSGAGYESFVEIKNNSGFLVSVTVTVHSGTGVTLGTYTATISAYGNIAVGVGGQFGLTASSGSVDIAHTGLPGGVSANVTALSGTTGLSFDAPATPRMIWSTFN